MRLNQTEPEIAQRVQEPRLAEIAVGGPLTIVS
jgi:hypothetical protein